VTKISISGDTDIDLGPLAGDLIFMVRTLQAMLRPEGQAIRESLDVEAGMIGVLAIVWRQPGISQNDLATLVALKKSAVTKVVKDLEARGLLVRQRVSQDRRMNALELTENGRAVIEGARALSDALNARLFEGIDGKDRDTFFRVLENLFARLAGGSV